MKHSIGIILLAALAAGCSDAANENGSLGSTTPAYERVEADGSLLGATVQPVRIGELGANFAACNASGTTRDRAAGGPVPVRAAPFDQAEEVDQLPARASFFICTRSHDQRWFGIVYEEGGRTSEACGVSRPINVRRDYDGPCASGWVSSALVRLVSGVPHKAADPEGGQEIVQTQ
jgi:hypothetical protein